MKANLKLKKFRKRGAKIIAKINKREVKMDDLVAKYFAVKADLKPTTIRTVKNRISKWILPYLGDIDIDRLDYQMVLEWTEHLKQYLSADSARQLFIILRELLDIAVDFFGLEFNPARKIKLRFKSERKPKEVWTKEEFEEFIAKVLDPHYKAFYTILYYTGMRLGEILGLQYDDIDTKTGAVIINKNLQYIDGKYVYQSPKTSRSNRVVYLNNEALKIYKKYLGTIGIRSTSDRIFYLTPYKYRSYLKMICKMHNLKPISLHGFRHSFATEMISKGVPVNFVSSWLGHSKISTTLDIYTQDTDKGNKVVLEFLNK